MPFDAAGFSAAELKKQARREKSMRETRMYRGYRAGRALGHAAELLRGGRGWTTGAWHDDRSRYCLVGALREARRQYRRGDRAEAYLRAAALEIYGIEIGNLSGFNDRCKSFCRIGRILTRAREMAAKDAGGL